MEDTMRLLLIALSLPLVVAATDAPKKPQASKVTTLCQAKQATPAQDGVLDGTRSARVRTLGELPPAKQQLAVIRTLDGCSVPTVIRENIGGQ
jgi:hypothetical protein